MPRACTRHCSVPGSVSRCHRTGRRWPELPTPLPCSVGRRDARLCASRPTVCCKIRGHSVPIAVLRAALCDPRQGRLAGHTSLQSCCRSEARRGAQSSCPHTVLSSPVLGGRPWLASRLAQACCAGASLQAVDAAGLSAWHSSPSGSGLGCRMTRTMSCELCQAALSSSVGRSAPVRQGQACLPLVPARAGLASAPACLPTQLGRS